MNEITIDKEQVSNVEALEFPSGTIFKVPWDGAIKYYIRTDCPEWPFVDLKDGSVSAGGSFTLIPLGHKKLHIS